MYIDIITTTFILIKCNNEINFLVDFNYNYHSFDSKNMAIVSIYILILRK